MPNPLNEPHVGDGCLAREIVEETLINLERLESELARVKRRLLEHLKLPVGTDL